ncbi:MAG: PadR family transcriptional regulator [Oscillospiraceae bacterium]|nr:PadR family transcriptional regulator [Oscillospiraceae bacterium]
MDKELGEIVSGFLVELRRGTVILCVLSRLRRAAYGYQLITDLAETGMPVEANTLYPLLRRLEAQGLLESAWNTEGTKPRKYYAATALGLEALSALKSHWQTAARNMDKILEEEPS